MFFSIPSGGCGPREAIYTIARNVDPEHWNERFVERQSWQALCAYVREGRLRAYIVTGSGQTCEAERSQFGGLADCLDRALNLLTDIEGTPFRDSHGRRVPGELFFYENDLHAVLRAKSAANAVQKGETWKGRRGRIRRYDRDMIEAEVSRLLDDHGEFAVADRKWNCRARLEEAVMQFCKEKFRKEPARSTLQASVLGSLTKWREKKRQEAAEN